MTYENWSARGRAPDDADEAELRAALGAERPKIRQDAALALVDRADGGLEPKTIAALQERARGDHDPNVRQFTAEALGIAGAGTETLRALLDDAEPWVRAEAVVGLSRVGAGTEVFHEALEDESGWVRRNAVVALGKRGDADQSLLVEQIKTDPHPAAREYAAQFLADVAEDVEEAERILAALLAREPNAFVRAKAAESLGRLGTDRAEEALERHGVTDQSEDVARTAKQALAAARGTDPDNLDVEIGPPSAPGSGPGTPAEQSVDGFRTGGQGVGWDGESAEPGGAPGFEPRRDLDTEMENR